MAGGEAAAELEYTGERMLPERSDTDTFWEHVYRYQFAGRFVAGRRVLDVACGEGYGTAALGRFGAKSVLGVDVSAEACEHARRKYGIDTLCASATDIPLPAGSFDAVVSFETVEHIPDPPAFVRECARLLRPGGLLVISTPNKLVYGSGENPFHCAEMTEAEFAGLLAADFGRARMYAQAATAAAWYSPRSLAARRSAWRSVPGYWRLALAACPQLFADDIDGYRRRVVETILTPDSRLARAFNPYRVRRRSPWSREEPRYLVAVARKGRP